MSDAQNRARELLRAYVALHDALCAAASEVPEFSDDEISAASMAAKQEYSLYCGLRERFRRHLENDAYWHLMRIAAASEETND